VFANVLGAATRLQSDPKQFKTRTLRTEGCGTPAWEAGYLLGAGLA